jgi:hypothetical protein
VEEGESREYLRRIWIKTELNILLAKAQVQTLHLKMGRLRKLKGHHGMMSAKF